LQKGRRLDRTAAQDDLAARISSPSARTTPTARSSSMSTRAASALPRISRFARSRTGLMYAAAAEKRRVPTRDIGVGPIPCASV